MGHECAGSVLVDHECGEAAAFFGKLGLPDVQSGMGNDQNAGLHRFATLAHMRACREEGAFLHLLLSGFIGPCRATHATGDVIDQAGDLANGF